MKKILLALMILFTILPAKTIYLVSDVWAPYTMNQKNEKSGYIIDIVKTIFEKEGY